MRFVAWTALSVAFVVPSAALAQSAASGPPAQPAPALPAIVQTAPAQPTVVLIDAYPAGVDPSAATFVTATLRQALSQGRYPLVPTSVLYETAHRMALPFPPPADGIAMLLQALAVPIAVTCELRGASGYYQAILRVRFAAESGERVRQVMATQWTLGDAIRLALPSLLAPPLPAAPGAPISPQGVPPPFGTPPNPYENPYAAYGGRNGYGYYDAPPRPPATRLHPRPFEFALGAEFALGPGSDSFFNVLGYARGAWFPFDRFGLTASVAYANVQGRNDRPSNVLFMAGVETAVDLLPRQHVSIPLRVEGGYLPYNGPVFRATAGVAFDVGTSTRVELDLLSPTVWFLPGVTAASLDLGVQVVFGLGSRSATPDAAAASAAPEAAPVPTPHRRHRRRPPSSAPPGDESSASPAPTATNDASPTP